MKKQLSKSEVNHLRRLLAWMRVEYCLDENMQRGGLTAIKMLLDSGDISQEQADFALNRKAEQIRQVPAYLRQAVKMLQKAIADTESETVDIQTRNVDLVEKKT